MRMVGGCELAKLGTPIVLHPFKWGFGAEFLQCWLEVDPHWTSMLARDFGHSRYPFVGIPRVPSFFNLQKVIDYSRYIVKMKK